MTAALPHPRSTDPASFEPFYAVAEQVLGLVETERPQLAASIKSRSSQWSADQEPILRDLHAHGFDREQLRSCLLSWWLTSHKGSEWIHETIERISTVADKAPTLAFVTYPKSGLPIPNPVNIDHALQLGGLSLRFDAFRRRYEVRRGDAEWTNLTDEFASDLRSQIERLHNLRYSFDYLERELRVIARRHSFHPVRSYLSSLHWDDRPRIDDLLSTYAGCDPSEYTAEVGRCFMLAAVARIMDPGCKFDQMMILEGKQGSGKSSFLRALCPDESWFTDRVELTGDQGRFIEGVTGRWIVEIPEMSGFSRADMDRVKSLLSAQNDHHRLAYARSTTELPRQCVLTGSTNEKEYLRDQTGNRRFWPLATGTIDVEKLKADRDQLWAEAVKRYKSGEAWMMRQEVWASAASEQAARTAPDAIAETLSDLLGGFDSHRIATSSLRTLLGIEAARCTTDQTKRICAAMYALNWKKGKLPATATTPRTNGFVIGEGHTVLSSSGAGQVILSPDPFRLPITGAGPEVSE